MFHLHLFKPVYTSMKTIGLSIDYSIEEGDKFCVLEINVS